MFRVRANERHLDNYGEWIIGKSQVWRYPHPKAASVVHIAEFIKSCKHDVIMKYELTEHNKELNKEFYKDFIHNAVDGALEHEITESLQKAIDYLSRGDEQE